MEEKEFINRQAELDQLKRCLSRSGPELIILYGRRRIGKSRLLREIGSHIKIDITIMFEDADYQTNLNKMINAMLVRYQLASFKPKSFRELFQAIPKKSIIVIDEFSYIANAIGEFQAIWEEIARPNQLKLILCGSFIRIMEDLNYSLSSPLYGRATQIIKLMPLSFQYLCEWYPESVSLEDILHIYFALGGIPRYLELISEPSLINLKHLFFSKDSLLLREGKLLLKESFPSSLIIPKVLITVAMGTSEVTAIANEIPMKASEISKYLSILCEYGYIERKYPIIGGTKKSVRYYPSDRYISFWGRFIANYYNEIEAGYNENAMRAFDMFYSSYEGFQFEKLILELLHIYPDWLPFRPIKIGPQWGKIPSSLKPTLQKESYEIDIFGFDEKEKNILLGECKWQENVDAVKIFYQLQKKEKYIILNHEIQAHIYLICAKSFKSKVNFIDGNSVFCYDLTDINQLIRGNLEKANTTYENKKA